MMTIKDASFMLDVSSESQRDCEEKFWCSVLDRRRRLISVLGKSLASLTVNQTESLKFDIEVQHYQISFLTMGNIQKEKKTVTYDIVSSYPSVFLCCCSFLPSVILERASVKDVSLKVQTDLQYSQRLCPVPVFRLQLLVLLSPLVAVAQYQAKALSTLTCENFKSTFLSLL